MDFKSILNKLDSMEAPKATPAAPVLEKAVQLNEDAELRVLAGTASYISEAKKVKDKKVDEVFDDSDEVGTTKKTASGGTATKTATGLVHKGKKYGGSGSSEEKADDQDDDKKAKKESIDTEAFKGKFAKMVEAKKKSSKPDFLDVDKDGDKKEPMKKAVKDKNNAKGAFKDMFGGGAADLTRNLTVKKKKTTEGKLPENADKKVAGSNNKGMSDKQAKYFGKKKTVKESVEQKLSFKDMVRLVQESGGQQTIDPVDTALFNWAQRVAANKFTESTKAELYAGLIYERNGGTFEMYDVLSEATISELSPQTLQSYAGKAKSQGNWAAGVAKYHGKDKERPEYQDTLDIDPEADYGQQGNAYAKLAQKRHAGAAQAEKKAGGDKVNPVKQNPKGYY
jgi:hypothetical protein